MRPIFVLFVVSVVASAAWESREDALVDDIIVDCTKKADLSCISGNAEKYFLGTFDSDKSNWDVTDDVGFKRNEQQVSPRQSRVLGDESLYERAKQYVETHDFTLALPETLFNGAVLRVKAPGQGATKRTLFSVELEAPEGAVDADDEEASQEAEKRSLDTGRFFIKKIFSQKIKKKLLFGFFALLLIIKLIKIKLFFLLPLILGVGTVKKLAIKFLFFVFPALASLFKTCHQHHHHGPVKQYHIHHLKHHGGGHHHHDDYHGPPDYWKRQDASESPADYLVDPAEPSKFSSSYSQPSPVAQSPYSGHQQLFSDDREEERRKVKLAYELDMQKRLASINQNNVHSAVSVFRPNVSPAMRRGQQVQVQKSIASEVVASTDEFDPFYSPILSRIDDIFRAMSLGDSVANVEVCRELAVCKMYQTPEKYAPNSNLISAELSREPEELQKPQTANEAVRRFFVYVQAAKDGQDQKNCDQHYPGCPVSV
ncbi:Hypothetical predicted protein [Cloeon dipterum]|uniref:Uncharacterized protein n=1 Tax=Cloeon dipterum TaxID=197152 RepID=A0A8S1DRM4_9INSE|nr:Hypothetical predicted protein [Cloeon dipterum]